MTADDDLLQERRRTWGIFVKISGVVTIFVAALLGILALALL